MDSNECMAAKLACMRMRHGWALPVAALVLAFATLTIGAAEDMSDDLPTSVVMWVCPDEPFAAGIGKLRHYRKAFETKDGLVKATGRWWVDDDGAVKRSPYTFTGAQPESSFLHSQLPSV